MRKARSAAAFSALSLMLLAGQVAPVFADEVARGETPPAAEQTNNKVKVTISEPGENLTYSAYQLFTGSFNGTVSADFGKIEEGKEKEGLSGLSFGDAAFGAAAGENGVNIVNAINSYMKDKEGWTDYTIDETTGKLDKDSSTSAPQQVVDLFKKHTELQTASFANHLAKELKESKTLQPTSGTAKETTVNNETVKTVEFDLDKGYYLIVSDKAEGVQDPGKLAHTTAILLPVNGALTMKSKSSLPTVDKTVKDIAGGGGNPDYKDVASMGVINKTEYNEDGTVKEEKYEINDVEFKLEGTVAKNISDFKTYFYEFVDTMPNGLVLAQIDLANWTFGYTISGTTSDGTAVTKTFTADEITALTNNNKWLTGPTVKNVKTGEGDAAKTVSTVKWTFNDLLPILAEVEGLDTSYDHAEDIKVVITYKPKYTTDQIKAIWANNQQLNAPQVNKVYVNFSNDPQGTGKGKTEEDDAKVYSFNLNFTKKGEGSDADRLTGAEFTLTDATGNTVGKVLKADENGVFEFTGLDAGIKYTLTETKVPDGYKAIDPIVFEIEQIEGVGTDGKPAITGIKVKFDKNPGGAFHPSAEEDVQKDENGKVVVGEDEQPIKLGTFTFTTATIGDTVQNVKGPNMPVTGQAGIWTGVAVGGLVLAVSAVAILKNKKEEA